LAIRGKDNPVNFDTDIQKIMIENAGINLETYRFVAVSKNGKYSLKKKPT